MGKAGAMSLGDLKETKEILLPLIWTTDFQHIVKAGMCNFSEKRKKLHGVIS